MTKTPAEVKEYLATIRKTVADSQAAIDAAQLRLKETDRLLESQGLTREQVLNFKVTPAHRLAVNEELRRRGPAAAGGRHGRRRLRRGDGATPQRSGSAACGARSGPCGPSAPLRELDARVPDLTTCQIAASGTPFRASADLIQSRP